LLLEKKEVCINDIMCKKIVSVNTNDTILEIANVMNKYKVGSVLVYDKNGSLKGIITERDILQKIVAKGKDSNLTLAKNIMTKKIVTGKKESKI